MQAFGNDKHIPILDQLPKKVYYLPTVTHQVIEQSSDLKQLLLCLPPTAGESVVERI
jgi:hypothetical protein